MSVRTSYSEVTAILDTDLTSDRVEALITDASAWVDEHLVGVGIADTMLAVIEKNIAAHLCVLAGEGGDGQVVQAQRADISERYAQRGDKDGGATSYIKTAAAYDKTGRVREHWLGGKRVMFRVGDGYNFTGATG
jgi:ribosome modulation factor